MTKRIHPMCDELQEAMEEVANPDDAAIMQRYMKTDQAFYGIKRPVRTQIFNATKKRYPGISGVEFDSIVRRLWSGNNREDMYMALEVVDGYKKQFLNLNHWPLYSDLIHTATWWDTLDWIATRYVGPILQENPQLTDEVFSWSDHDSFWVRRASILAHLNHKKDAKETNEEILEATILKLAHEKEFFIRKAIGWVLRQYSRKKPQWVIDFVAEHEEKLSPLSKREALRLLKD